MPADLILPVFLLENLKHNRYNKCDVWVWRSLVARVNGVHEAGGSIPLTQTIFNWEIN